MGALVECARHGEGGGHTADGVADGKACSHRPLPGVASDRHDATHSLDLAIVGGRGTLRTGLTEARHCTVNEPWVDPGQRLVADPHAIHDARAEVFHHHIGLANEAVNDLDRLGLGKVEGYVALVGVYSHPGWGHVARGPFMVERTAAHVFSAWPLDLDHIRAEQSQLIAAEGTGKNLREVEDTDARERLGHATVSLLTRVTPASSRNSLATAFCLSNSARRRAISSGDI